jgi:predicted Zn finger-like uncharacterized protein
MKIVCDNCATKYSIADDKVRGKVFKIRCKKCSHIIVVRGQDGAGAAAAAEPAPKFDQKETKVFDYSGADGEAAAAAGQQAPAAASSGDAPVWHLVIDREQVGPMTAEEVRQRFARGECDGETYAWREGFGDWQKLSAIGDFGDLMAAAPAAQASFDAGGGDATARSDAADLFAQSGANAGHDDGHDDGLFASAPATTSDPAPGAFLSSNSGETPAVSDMFTGQASGRGGGLFEAPAASHGGPGLFEAAPAASHGGGGGGLFEAGAGAAPSPRVDAARMTGQRNENSVLFSLSNLQALAVGQQGGGGAAAAPAPTARPGYASSQTEGSGLIDIRAMAASTLGAPTMGGGGGGGLSVSAPEEELAPFGATFSPVAAPVLMPMAGQASMPKWLWGLIGGGVLLVGVLIFLVIKLLSAKPAPPVYVQPPPTTTPTTGQGSTTPVPGVTAKAGEEKKPEEKKPEEKAEDKGHAKIASANPGGKHHKADPKQVAKDLELMKTPADKGQAPPPPPTKKKDTGPKAGGDDLDKLLSGAVGGKDVSSPKNEGGGAARERSAPAASDENLPDQLKPGDIQRGMAGIKGRVQNCYAQYNVPGMVQVVVTINGSGRVASAQVTGKFAGTPTGTCVASAVKGASFPRFKGQAMTGIEYPFMLSK